MTTDDTPIVRVLRQEAPYPDALEAMIADIHYKAGWDFSLYPAKRGQGCIGLTLAITITAPDTNNLSRLVTVVHYMIVPAATYNPRSWRKWLFDQIMLVEQHEAAEFFRIGDVQPFAPLHGEGDDPYMIAIEVTPTDRSKTFRDSNKDAQ